MTSTLDIYTGPNKTACMRKKIMIRHVSSQNLYFPSPPLCDQLLNDLLNHKRGVNQETGRHGIQETRDPLQKPAEENLSQGCEGGAGLQLCGRHCE